MSIWGPQGNSMREWQDRQARLDHPNLVFLTHRSNQETQKTTSRAPKAGDQGVRIDLRYVLPVGVFCLPGLLMLMGAWLLGYSTADARGFIAVLGGFVGFVLAGTVAGVLSDGDPIHVTLFRKDQPQDKAE